MTSDIYIFMQYGKLKHKKRKKKEEEKQKKEKDYKERKEERLFTGNTFRSPDGHD